MLVEIQCDKFKKDGQVREPIRFHEGLNAVLKDGAEKASVLAARTLAKVRRKVGLD